MGYQEPWEGLLGQKGRGGHYSYIKDQVRLFGEYNGQLKNEALPCPDKEMDKYCTHRPYNVLGPRTLLLHVTSFNSRAHDEGAIVTHMS